MGLGGERDATVIRSEEVSYTGEKPFQFMTKPFTVLDIHFVTFD